MWAYDVTNLTNTTSDGRVNVVRFLLGDTDRTDEQVQNEEITFALSQATNNPYYAAAFCAASLAAKYSRFVDTDLDGALAEKYSDLAKAYRRLSSQLRSDGQKYLGNSLGVFYGGTSYAQEHTVNTNTDRPRPDFHRDQFRIDMIGSFSE